MRYTQKTQSKRSARRSRQWTPLGHEAKPKKHSWYWIFHNDEVKAAYLSTIFAHHKFSNEFYPAAGITHYMRWDKKKPSKPRVYLEPIERVDYMDSTPVEGQLVGENSSVEYYGG